MDPKRIFGTNDQNSPYINLAIGLLAGVAVLVAGKQLAEKGAGVLAEVDGTSFREESLDIDLKAKIEALDGQKHQILADTVQNWIDSVVLSREAQKQGLSSAIDLLKTEVGPKLTVAEDEVYRRYAESPRAESFPTYEEALDAIRGDMQSRQYEQIKRQYLESLYPNHSIKKLLKVPAGFKEPSSDSTDLFPAYRVKPARPEFDGMGTVVAPPTLGPKDAKVVLEVYSDFMCPYSAKFSQSTNAIAQKYPDKVRIEYRHNPLPFHKSADFQAEASVCAQEQGKFWAYHDAVFANQGPKESVEEFSVIAKSLGLDADRFIKCVTSRKYQKYVQNDMLEGQKAGVRGTPSWFLNGRFRSGAAPLEMIIPQIDWLLNPNGQMPIPRTGPGPQPQAQKQAPAAPYAFKEEDIRTSPSLGAAAAPVTWIEFIDYKCGYCKRAVNIVDELLKQYAGKVRFVSKNYPLSENTKGMAAAALCANDQRKYWEYRKALFAMESEAPTVEEYKKLAGELRLNTKSFGACVESKKHSTAVENDISLAGKAGVNGTPTYYINGRQVVGANIEGLKKAIEEEIAKNRK